MLLRRQKGEKNGKFGASLPKRFKFSKLLVGDGTFESCAWFHSAPREIILFADWPASLHGLLPSCVIGCNFGKQLL